MTSKKTIIMYGSDDQHQALKDLCLQIGFTDTRRRFSKHPVPNMSAFFQTIADNVDDPELQAVLKRLKEKE